MHQIHHGRNIKRLREIQGVKQSTLALDLGEGWSQKKVSMLESRPTISKELLGEVATALGLTPEAIENFQESSLCKHLTGTAISTPNNSSPGGLELVGKLLELLEENRALYHCLLEAEKEKNRLLKQSLRLKVSGSEDCRS